MVQTITRNPQTIHAKRREARRFCLQAPPEVLPQTGADLPYAAPFIPPPSLPPPESINQEPASPRQTRRRKAVLIGCNYVNVPPAALKGCVQDAVCLYQLLTRHFG